MPVLVRVRLRRSSFPPSMLKALAQKILVAAGESHAELSMELVGDGRMRRLNREYRGRDAATDVLAFSMREAPSPPSPLLGDVIISLPTAARQAQIRGHSLTQEITTLLVHGILHLCGYDHERGDHEARRMRRREQTLLRSLRPLPDLLKKR